MSEIVYPRSIREEMDGWIHLPRFVDKIRLSAADRLHADYQPNLGKGFDGAWLDAAGVNFEEFVAFVHGTVCDGQVYDWVRTHVKKSDDDKQRFRKRLFKTGTEGAYRERLATRKMESGLEGRDDILCFVDYIDADEGRI
jgi:hypothetical protein